MTDAFQKADGELTAALRDCQVQRDIAEQLEEDGIQLNEEKDALEIQHKLIFQQNENMLDDFEKLIMTDDRVRGMLDRNVVDEY